MSLFAETRPRLAPLYNTLPLAYIETPLISKIRQAEDRPGEEGIREMSRETERTSGSRLKVIESH